MISKVISLYVYGGWIMEIFYTPRFARLGDVVPYYDKKRKQLHHFYLKNPHSDAPEGEALKGWHYLGTEDNLNFIEKPIHIRGGTGCIVEVDNIYHMFYCTFDFDKTPVAQWCRHAVSKDLENWTDILEDKFGPDGVIYKDTDWRDPFVFWNEEENKWWMLIAARENINTQRNGCVGLCVSDDLKNWEYRKPFYSPRINQAANECPDLFKIGDWYYLVYSNYTDGFATYYRMSRSINGPWIRPTVDTFDGRAYYAAKTATDGVNHYAYGWNPTKGGDIWGFDPNKNFGQDYKTWDWGGTLVVHQLTQHEDGTLGVSPVEAVKNAFNKDIIPTLNSLEGIWEINENIVKCKSWDGFSSALSSEIPNETCKLEAKISFSDNTREFGLSLFVGDEFADGYYFIFNTYKNMVEFKTGVRMSEDGGKMFPYAIEMERPIVLSPCVEYDISIYIQDSVGLMYINNDVAFSFRMYNKNENHLGFFVCDGEVKISDINYHIISKENI